MNKTALIFGLFSTLLLHIILVDCLVSGDQIVGVTEWGIILGFFFVTYQIALISRVLGVWRKLSQAIESTEPNVNSSQSNRSAIIHRGFVEMYFYLIASLTVLCGIAYLSASAVFKIPLQLRIGVDYDPLHVSVFVGLSISSFFPLLVGNYLKSKLESKKLKVKFVRTDVITATSFIVFLAALGLIVALVAAASSGDFKMAENFGVFVTGLVVIAFLSVIFIPNITRWLRTSHLDASRVHSMGPSSIDALLGGVTKPLSMIDSYMVKVIAPLSGSTEKRTGHFLLVLIMLLLSSLGFVLASPFGLIPISFAMILAFALGRRWAWVEEDRDTASRLQSTRKGGIHIGFENDFKDEALLAYASFFVLVPLTLHQIQGWLAPFQEVQGMTSGNAFVDWLRFFGAELAKAVPFVDWFEIYNVDVKTPFSISNESSSLAKHLTFGARAMVDLVIMAALLQALGISHRRRTERKLYKAGQLKSFDPFLEADFFESGMRYNREKNKWFPSEEFFKEIKEHCDNCEIRNEPRVPYSVKRLNELVLSKNDALREGALWMQVEFNLLVGPPTKQLEQLFNFWKTKEFIQHIENLRSKSRENSDKAEEFVWKQKAEFERILLTISEEGNIGSVQLQQLNQILALLRLTKNVPEFALSQKLAIQLIGATRTAYSVSALLANVVDIRHLNHPAFGDKWNKSIKIVTAVDPRKGKTNFQTQEEFRVLVYKELGRIKYDDCEIRSKEASEILECMQDVPKDDYSFPYGDRSRFARGYIATFSN
ncbi:hypothetical protein [Hirschia litorea]|uniref:Uncharacterized protein n=1 Tax=Hirschia litorea TaxID=1199156 RepID=A0ABW2IJG1_9PROT